MARNKFSDSFKIKIIEEYKSGYSQYSLAQKYNINKSVISRLVNKYITTGNVSTLHLGGRPRKTTQRTDMRICALIKKDPFITSKEIVNTLNLSVHDSTVRKRALENNLRSYRPAKKPMLTRKHLQKR